jgi:hypothetical protein
MLGPEPRVEKCCGGATVETVSICSNPRRRTVSSTPLAEAVEELRADRDPACPRRQDLDHPFGGVWCPPRVENVK